MRKNAPGHESAPGPYRHTRQAEIAPSAYASIVSRHISASRSLLELWAAIAFVCDGVLDGRQDIPRRPALRALEPRDGIGQLRPADAAIEFIRFDAMPAFAAVAPLGAERALYGVVEATGRQVVPARRLVLNHDRLLSVRTSRWR